MGLWPRTMRLNPIKIFKVIIGILVEIIVVVQGHMLWGDFSLASILSRCNKPNKSHIHEDFDSLFHLYFLGYPFPMFVLVELKWTWVTLIVVVFPYLHTFIILFYYYFSFLFSLSQNKEANFQPIFYPVYNK